MRLLSCVLHEDHTYLTGPGADARSWDRDTEIGQACAMAKKETVRSLRLTPQEIGKGAAGEFSVRAQVESCLVFDTGDSSSVSTEMVFTMRRDPNGDLRVWRQVDLTRAKH
jgi:hypothetical protein